MADNDNITIVGSVGFDPDFKVDGNGLPRVMLRVASDQWQKNRESKEWEKGQPNWYSVVAFRFLARNAAASLHKGERVIVTGTLKLREWVDAGGVKRVRPEIIASSIGHDLNWGTSSYSRPLKSARIGGDEQPPSESADAGDTESWSAEAPSIPGSGFGLGDDVREADNPGEEAADEAESAADGEEGAGLVTASSAQEPVF